MPSRRPQTRPKSPPWSPSPRQSPTSLPPKLKAAPRRPPSSSHKKRPGKRLLSFDRAIGARFVAGADEAGRGSLLRELTPPAEACLVDGFRLGPQAPTHTAVVDGDEPSAAIAAASVVAKVTRDRLMRRMDALYPHYGFSSHVGYITPGHAAV